MTEPKTPVFNPKNPSIQIRDRARPNVAFQQDDNLFDRKKHFVTKSDVTISIKKKEAPAPVTRDITQRKVGGTSAVVVGKIDVKPKAPVKPAAAKGVDAVLRRNAKENAQAAQAEAAAA